MYTVFELVNARGGKNEPSEAATFVHGLSGQNGNCARPLMRSR